MSVGGKCKRGMDAFFCYSLLVVCFFTTIEASKGSPVTQGNTPINQSMLDTDVYKFTMGNIAYTRYPQVETEFKFKLRSKGISLLWLKEQIESELGIYKNLTFKSEEVDYLESLGLFGTDYLEFLRSFRNSCSYSVREVDGTLDIRVKGPWSEAIFWEIPVLFTVNELYNRTSNPERDYAQGEKRLGDKIVFIKKHPLGKKFRLSEFGTRRRDSLHWQRMVTRKLRTELPDQYVGTSNVLLAKEMGMAPSGTMAHEFFQAHQALVSNLKDFQKQALKVWLEVYKGRLGIALSDIVGFNAFLDDFDSDLAAQYSGARHDSGDPFLWGDKLIKHYLKFGIDPMTKLAVFSDGLNIKAAFDLLAYFDGRIKTGFGIGTHLTNDLGYSQLSMVMKMVSCNDKPVAKISDSPGKSMCEIPAFENRLLEMFYRPLAEE